MERLYDSLKEYKVLSLRDRWLSGKFDASALENALNSYAQQGWTVKAAFPTQIPSFAGTREEALIIMERART